MEDPAIGMGSDICVMPQTVKARRQVGSKSRYLAHMSKTSDQLKNGEVNGDGDGDGDRDG